MTVIELIDKLNSYPDNYEVYFDTNEDIVILGRAVAIQAFNNESELNIIIRGQE